MGAWTGPTPRRLALIGVTHNFSLKTLRHNVCISPHSPPKGQARIDIKPARTYTHVTTSGARGIMGKIIPGVVPQTKGAHIKIFTHQELTPLGKIPEPEQPPVPIPVVIPKPVSQAPKTPKIFASSNPASMTKPATTTEPAPQIPEEALALLAVAGVKVTWLGRCWMAQTPAGKFWTVSARDNSFDKWRATLVAVLGPGNGQV